MYTHVTCDDLLCPSRLFVLDFLLCYFSRDDGSYCDRRFIDERFSRENAYPRGTFNQDVLERDNYHPLLASVGMWPQTRRSNYDEEYYKRDYRGPARYGERDHEDYGYDDYDLRSVLCIKAGRAVMNGIMTTEDQVMIQTMNEATGEMVAGEGMNLGTVNGTEET